MNLSLSMLTTDMKLFRFPKLKAKVDSCLAIVHGNTQVSLAMARPHLENFLDAGEEEFLLCLVELDVIHHGPFSSCIAEENDRC